MKLDIRSADTVLTYVGPGVVSDAPAADLSANQLARIAWIRGGQKGDPTAVTEKAITAVRDDLIATGIYTATKEAKS